MKLKDNILPLGVALLIVFLIKLYNQHASTSDVQWVIAMPAWCVSLFFSAPFEYSAEVGYAFPSLNIFIEKSCSGLNLIAITFLSFSLLILIRFSTVKKKLLLLIPTIAISTIVAILINTIRIIVSIILANITLTDSAIDQHDLHHIIGQVNNLLLLSIAFLVADYFIKKFHHGNIQKV